VKDVVGLYSLMKWRSVYVVKGNFSSLYRVDGREELVGSFSTIVILCLLYTGLCYGMWRYVLCCYGQGVVSFVNGLLACIVLNLWSETVCCDKRQGT